MGRRTIAAGLVAGTVVSLVVGGPAQALPGSPAGVQVPACSVRQLTSSDADSEQPEISGDGRSVAFHSDRLAGGAGDEVFLLEVDTGELTQLTTSPTGVSNQDVEIDLDGSRVAFVSNGDHAGQNVDANAEVFTVETATGAFTQRSVTTGGGSTSANKRPRMNDAGVVAWEGSRNPLGGNADGNLEVFLDQGPGDVQVTSTTGSGLELFGLDADLNVLFETSNDVATFGGIENPDTNQELFVAEPIPGESPILYAFTQITDTTGGHRVEASFSAGATEHIGIASNAVPFGSGGFEAAGPRDRIFMMSRPPGLTEVVTFDDGEGVSLDPAIAGEANTRIAFSSSADLTELPGDPPKGGFTPSDFSLVLELPEPAYTEALAEQDLGPIQVEVVSGGFDSYGHSPDIDRAGRRIVFESPRDLTGGNADGSDEVFVAFCGAGVPSFSDVGTGHPFFHEVEWMAAAGVTTGFPGGTFRPSAGVTRQSMSAFMFRLAGHPTFQAPATPTFPDVGTGHPFFREVEWMAEVGITEGFGDGTFRPAAPVTRQSMSAFMFRLAGVVEGDLDPVSAAPFPDVSLGHPFVVEIDWMVDEQITTGFTDGTFRPSAGVSRQGMSAFMHRLVRAGGPGLFGGPPGDD